MIQIGEGDVYHGRHGNVTNRFRYPIYFVLFPCSEEQKIKSIFRRNFLGLVSLRARDYLDGDKTQTLSGAIKAFLKEKCKYECDNVWLKTMPRMFGYAFNPISFWLCYKSNRLDAVLCEVNNTFGERHFYFINPESGIEENAWYEANKLFHVSPFYPVNGYYRFRFVFLPKSFHVDINYHADDKALKLATWTKGLYSPLANANLAQLLLRYGWMTPLVMIRIHTQALRLWFKRVRFYSKPPPPPTQITGAKAS